ncbi:ribonuclease T2 family protein [Telmatospirillum siberiense]|nr:ribonuclease T [Telmatospirillum siberiense]
MPRRLILLVLFCLLSLSGAHAQQGARRQEGPAFLLSLSWSPDYCAHHGHERTARSQCRGRTAYGFIVHGLWPEEEPAQAACRPAGSLPPPLVERMMPIMPSAGLIEHEWATHGRCSGFSADDYFDRVSQAFLKVQIPDRLQHPDGLIVTDVVHLKRWFQEANPGLQSAMMSVHCEARGTNLREIRFCMGKALDFRPCAPAPNDQCPNGAVRIAPVP